MTEVISIAGLSNIEQLIECAGADVVENAAHRGNQVHGYCELVDLDDQFDVMSVPENYRGYVEAYIAFRTEMRFEPIYSEHVVVAETYAFAGTVDRIGVLGTGQVAVIDLKTPAVPSPSWAVQTAGYALAVEDSGLSTQNVRGSVRLRRDGTYRFDRHRERSDLDVFLAALTVAHYRLAHGLAQLES